MENKLKPPFIGIDPGVSNGGIAVLEYTIDGPKLRTHKMKESFSDLKELLKPYGGSPFDKRCRCSIELITMRPGQDSFKTARMQPLLLNFNRLKDVLTELYIPFQEVAPVTWQKYHRLILPKESEKGVDYEKLRRLKKEAKQIPLHLAIERNSTNDVVLSENVKYILSTSNKKEAREALNDDFAFFSKNDLNLALKEIEKEIEKIKNHEKRVRKNRYKAKASQYANRKVVLWEADAILILLYQKYNIKNVK